MWQVIGNYIFDTKITQIIEALYTDARRDDLQIIPQDNFSQRSIMFPVMFNIYLEHTMLETLNVYNISIAIGGRPFSNLWFNDNIDLTAGTEVEFQDLRLWTVSRSMRRNVAYKKQ